MAYKNIEDRRAYQKQYMRERREWYKEHGWCTACGKEDARTMIGKTLCFDCFVKKWGGMNRLSCLTPKRKKSGFQNMAFLKVNIMKMDYVLNAVNIRIFQISAYASNAMRKSNTHVGWAVRQRVLDLYIHLLSIQKRRWRLTNIV